MSFSPELSTVNYPPVMSRKRNFHEVKDYEDYEQGGYRRHETRTQTSHNIIQVNIDKASKSDNLSLVLQGPVVTSMMKVCNNNLTHFRNINTV